MGFAQSAEQAGAQELASPIFGAATRCEPRAFAQGGDCDGEPCSELARAGLVGVAMPPEDV